MALLFRGRSTSFSLFRCAFIEAYPAGVIGNLSAMTGGIRNPSEPPGQFVQVLQPPQPLAVAQPVGQLTVPHDPMAQVAVQLQESVQVMLPQALVPVQPTWQARSSQPMLPHAFVPLQVIAQ